MIIERMTNLSNGISPLRNLTNKYQDSTKPDPSAFLMKEKLFLGKISLFGKASSRGKGSGVNSRPRRLAFDSTLIFMHEISNYI